MHQKRWNVGDKVVITEACLERMFNSNRSTATAGCPDDAFLEKARYCVGTPGEVTHTFPPGYEVTACFGTQSFHMKDHWIEAAQEAPTIDPHKGATT